jgi:hypothetical protein
MSACTLRNISKKTDLAVLHQLICAHPLRSLISTLAAQGAGFVTIPIDMALFGGLGAWADHKNATTRVVVVYQATP